MADLAYFERLVQAHQAARRSSSSRALAWRNRATWYLAPPGALKIKCLGFLDANSVERTSYHFRPMYYFWRTGLQPKPQEFEKSPVIQAVVVD